MVDGEDTLSATDLSSTSMPSGPPRTDVETPPIVLVDRYQIDRRLGAGGMGVVYAARDIHLGRTVAVKLVSPRIEAGSGQGRLVREAQAMAKLRHPNIATIYDIGVSGDRLFVVMELIDGGTVADWMAAAPRSWRDIVDVHLQGGRGLAAAHAAGFVHRDFKPENLLVGKDGVARVSDFGVARIVEGSERAAAAEGGNEGSVSRSGIVAGTPGYIAPEILRGEPEDERADQFSFCVALVASLFGERPFAPVEGPNRTAETLGALPPLRGGVVPSWLLRIITRGLLSDPRDRWPTMAALVTAIERRLGRRPRAAAIAVLAGFAIVAAMVVAIRRPTSSTPPPEWSPVVMGRTDDGSLRAMTVSPDGSTVASISTTAAWVGPRMSAGVRHRLVLHGDPEMAGGFRLSHSNDRLLYALWLATDTWEIWSVDVATGRAERRLPAPGIPAILPYWVFDVGPDDEILFMGVGQRTAWRADRAGAVRHVMTVSPDESIDEAVWSPDGTRMAFLVNSLEQTRIVILTLATRDVSVVWRQPCRSIEWLTAHSLVCLPTNLRRASFTELTLQPGGGEAHARTLFNGPEFQATDLVYTSAAGVLFATHPFDHHLSLHALDGSEEVRPIPTGGATDLPAAGWTSSGSLIFGTSIEGQLRIMRRLPDGTIETVRMGPAAEVPLAVLGETIVFGRFPGGESSIPFDEAPFGRVFPDGELFRLAPDGALTPLGATRGFMALLCALGPAPRCLLQERSGDDVAVIDWDFETGARGRARARWNLKAYAGKSALSPDGRTLAQIERYPAPGTMSLLDLERGRRRSIAFRDTYFHFPTWQSDGSLYALGFKDVKINIFRLHDAETVEVAAVLAYGGTPTAGAEIQVADDGKTAAVLMTGGPRTFWWADNPPR